VCDIDILGLDGSGTPVIIECKWDRVDASALRQLAAYSRNLQLNWSWLEACGRKNGPGAASVKRRKPILVALGYRYDPSLLVTKRSVVCLTCSYHDVRVVGEVVKQRRGKVSVQMANVRMMPSNRHPTVSKHAGTDEKLSHMPTLRPAFWSLHARMLGLGEDVRPHHFKNVVNYHASRGQFARAKIQPESITWWFMRSRRGMTWSTCAMRVPSDAQKLFQEAQRSYRGAS
jgi:hypothetical protein